MAICHGFIFKLRQPGKNSAHRGDCVESLIVNAIVTAADFQNLKSLKNSRSISKIFST